MSLLKDRIDKFGYKLKGISNILDINYRTLQRWVNYENIDSFIKFLELMQFLHIQPNELIESFRKQNDETCSVETKKKTDG